MTTHIHAIGTVYALFTANLCWGTRGERGEYAKISVNSAQTRKATLSQG
jgi:hypothetical protein